MISNTKCDGGWAEGGFHVVVGIWKGSEEEEDRIWQVWLREGPSVLESGEANALTPYKVTAGQLRWGWSRNTSHSHSEPVSRLPHTSCLRGNCQTWELTVKCWRDCRKGQASFSCALLKPFQNWSLGRNGLVNWQLIETSLGSFNH